MTDDSLTQEEKEELYTAFRIAELIVSHEVRSLRFREANNTPLSTLRGEERLGESLQKRAVAHPLAKVILPEVRRHKQEKADRLLALKDSNIQKSINELEEEFLERVNAGEECDDTPPRETLDEVLVSIKQDFTSAQLILVIELLSEIKCRLLDQEHIPDVTPVRYTAQQVRDNMPPADG